MGGESFKAVEELGGFFVVLGAASHPGNLGVLEDGLGFEFLVQSGQEFGIGGFPGGTEEILDVPVFGRDAGRGGLNGAEYAKECASEFGASGRVLGLEERDEGSSESVVVLVVLEGGYVRGSEELGGRGSG